MSACVGQTYKNICTKFWPWELIYCEVYGFNFILCFSRFIFSPLKLYASGLFLSRQCKTFGAYRNVFQNILRFFLKFVSLSTIQRVETVSDVNSVISTDRGQARLVTPRVYKSIISSVINKLIITQWECEFREQECGLRILKWAFLFLARLR